MVAPRLQSDVVVVGVGARTATGLDALQVTMTARAGKLAARESRFIDARGEPIAVCRLRSIGDDVLGEDRLVALGAPALAKAVGPLAEAARALGRKLPPLPVILAIPGSERPGAHARLAGDLLPRIAGTSGVELAAARSEVVARGRAGAGEAVRRALERLWRGEDDVIVVGGVDSWFDPEALEHLDREMRLHSLGCENGFIPGEGAGFLVLARRSRALSTPRRAEVVSAAVELEPHPYGHAAPCQALGMTMALRRALEPAGARRVGWQLTDVLSERHRIDEWQLARARMFRAFAETTVHEEPLLRTGDLGAASAAVLLVIACVRFETATAPSDCCVIATHSDGPERAAVVLAAPSVEEVRP